MVNSHTLIEIGAASIEVMAVVLIVGAFLWSSVSFLFHQRKQASNRYEQYKLFFWVDRCRWGWSFLLQQT